MPTMWSNTLIPTSRQDPSDAEVPSHKLMIRAGILRRLGSGSYDYLPLGVRSLHKAMNIVRHEMDAIGAAEVFLPSLQPIELWEKTGRREAYGDNLFVVKDRHGREQALGPTHEEVITELASAYLTSYKDLPKTLYQIQTKFRDEFRPRFGILRSREFQMKDSYSFHITMDGEGGLNEAYDKHYQAYCRIFESCGLPYMPVEAEAGPIGGNASHEFMAPSPTGEDIILKSDKGNYAANVEKAEIGTREANFTAEPTATLETINTPNCPGIAEVVSLLGITDADMLKTLVFEASVKSEEDLEAEQQYEAQYTPAPREFVPDRFFVIAVVRGDHEVNEAKLLQAVKQQINPKIEAVALIEEHEAQRQEFAIGYVGPQRAVNAPLTRLIVDYDAAQPNTNPSGWVTGANQKDHHVKHFDWQRDVVSQLNKERAPIAADIRNARTGDPSPKNDGGVLEETRGIELGHIFKLGTKYSQALGATVLDDKNKHIPMLMGCYGVGVNRILAAAIECNQGHDENGIIWPAAIAPYKIVITPIKYAGEAAEAANKLANDLEAQGIDVLIDDRKERPGVKFKDADLIGIPVRIVVGDKGLANGEIEIKLRNGTNGPKGENIKLDTAIETIAKKLKSL
ncbi:Proline--tRNA ligase [Poriferisphaera corsica]|uniref:Proline--tRNA ligase n=1 Tax=Poriferisphaera corsica TaxID=2528020 RepID=A0A517YWW9_9BACT|nr:proline--tRNA ligase [Poriferisphaera corsica]QDU34721.1 Proline--tRNA ligase [Poriferisphaera corsica]